MCVHKGIYIEGDITGISTIPINVFIHVSNIIHAYMYIYSFIHVCIHMMWAIVNIYIYIYIYICINIFTD